MFGSEVKKISKAEDSKSKLPDGIPSEIEFEVEENKGLEIVRVDTMHVDVTIPIHFRDGDEFRIDHDGEKVIKVPDGQQGQSIRIRMIKS